MKKIYYVIGAFDARNLLAIVAIFLLMASCAKSEIAQNDQIANSSEATVSEEGSGDGQDNPQDPASGDPSDPGQPSEHGSDWISPDHFNMVQMDFGATSDGEALGTRTSALSREEPLDEFVTVSSADDSRDQSTRTSIDASGNITWEEGDAIKIYYYSGEPNYTQGTIKHGGAQSTINGWVNEDDEYYYAFYPYAGIVTSVSYDSYGAFTVTVPTEQDGKFENCHMAVGKASKNGENAKHFGFSNVGSYLKMTVTKPSGATSVTVTSLGDAIAGTFTVPFKDDAGTLDEENISVASGATNAITISLAGVSSGDDIYVAMLPGVTFNKGFLVRYNYSDRVTRPSWFYAPASPKTVVRRKILNCGPLDTRIVTNWFFKSGSTISSPSSLGNGASWEKALNVAGLETLLNSNTSDNDISYAQAARLDGATFHFADGTYTTTSEIVFSAPTYGENVNLTLLGGYPVGNTGTTTNNRSASNHATIISGDDDHRIFYLGSPFAMTFDNFKITEAYTEIGNGGGFYMEGTSTSDCTLSLNQVWFYDNYVENQPTTTTGSGGAVALRKGALTAANCTFEKGSGRNAGGVLVTGQPGANAATAVLTDCSFIDNETQSNCGAGLSANGGQISLIRCTFTNNHAALFGGGLHWDVSSSASPSLELSNCTFEGNYTNDATVGAHGGAISCQSGTLTLSNCSFTENHAGANNSKGGAIWVQGNVSGSNLTFTDNYASGDGGAVYVNNSGQFSMLSGNNSFTGNYSGYVDADTFADTEGGAIYMAGSGSIVHIKGNTSFNENYALKRAGAISFRGGTLKVENDGDNRPSFFKNNTIVEYESGETIPDVNGGAVGVYATTGSVTLTGCDFDANYLMGDADFANCYAEGGTMAILSESATNLTVDVTDCSFTNQYAGTSTLNSLSSATARNGAVLRLTINKDNTGTISFSNCCFNNNQVWNVGGVASHSSGTVSFSGCTFTENTAPYCSGVYHLNNANATANFTGCIFTGNVCSSGGAGSVCRLENGNLTLTSCTLSGNHSGGTSGSGVISMTGANSNLTVKGSTIQDNTANGHGYGGAIYFGAGSLTVTSSDGTASGTKSVIRGNTGSELGYAIYVNGDNKSTLTPSISYCVFDAKNSSGNVAPTSGHAIYVAGTTGSETLTMTGCEIKNFNRSTNTGLWWTNLLDSSDHTADSALSFTGCTFEKNTSPTSGGVFNYHRNVHYSLSLLNCAFNENAATGSGAQGGAIYTEKNLDAPGCTFYKNSSVDGGGAICLNFDPGLSLDFATSSVTTHGATFRQNEGSWGGAVYVRFGKYYANNASFQGNVATSSDWGTGGGAIYTYYNNAWFTLNDCSFSGNRAAQGGAIHQWEGVSWLNRCDFFDNTASTRAGAFFGGSNGISFMHACKFVGNSLTASGLGSAMAFSAFGWFCGNSLLFAKNTVSVGNESVISGSAYMLLTNSTLIGKITASNSDNAVMRLENRNCYIYHSIILPDTDATQTRSINANNNTVNTYHCIVNALTGSTHTQDTNKTGQSLATWSSNGYWTWNATNKIYTWNGKLSDGSDHKGYGYTSTLWTHVITNRTEEPTEGAYVPGEGIGTVFSNWLNSLPQKGASGTGVKNQDITGDWRDSKTGRDQPGCVARAYGTPN